LFFGWKFVRNARRKINSSKKLFGRKGVLSNRSLDGPGQLREVDLLLRIVDGGHSGAALGARNLDAVDDGVFELESILCISFWASFTDKTK
jgi:hypothetical protein